MDVYPVRDTETQECANHSPVSVGGISSNYGNFNGAIWDFPRSMAGNRFQSEHTFWNWHKYGFRYRYFSMAVCEATILLG